MNLRSIVGKIPVLGPVIRRIYVAATPAARTFPGSERYWDAVYRSGGNSGSGSYGQLADFKAHVVNEFVQEEKIGSVIEFGCGDGNQLSLAAYPRYTGYDVSPTAVAMCAERFVHDRTKEFKLLKDYDGQKAELTLSLDVIYHLIEDQVFAAYMSMLFDASERFVIIYSPDHDHNRGSAPHVRYRKFTTWVRSNRPDWMLLRHIPNKFPYQGDSALGSDSDFYVFGNPTSRAPLAPGDRG